MVTGSRKKSRWSGKKKYRIQDYIGKTFGNWLVLSQHSGQYWNVRCKCGKTGRVRATYLIRGNKSHSCHLCSKSKYPIEKYAGKTFNNWTVISFSHRDRQQQHYWNVRCKCGRRFKVRASYIMRRLSSGCRFCGADRAKLKRWRGGKFISGSLFLRYRWGARIRRLPFKISIKDMERQWKKQHGLCAYTKQILVLPLLDGRRGADFAASLDRIDSKKGYVRGNIEWVIKGVNVMKRVMSKDDFIALCKLVAAGQRKAA